MPKEKPENNDLCEPKKCDSLCCRYITINIGAPVSLEDFDELKWYVTHKGITVFQDTAGNWHASIIADCENLEKNRCTDYSHRSNVCRNYGPPDCIRSMDDIPAKVILNTPADVEKYAADNLYKQKKKKPVRSKRKPAAKRKGKG